MRDSCHVVTCPTAPPCAADPFALSCWPANSRAAQTARPGPRATVHRLRTSSGVGQNTLTDEQVNIVRKKGLIRSIFRRRKGDHYRKLFDLV